MIGNPHQKPIYAIGPDGRLSTLADLPSSSIKRWLIQGKAIVIAAVRSGLLSLKQACDRYFLTEEEFLSWKSSIGKHGLAGLRIARHQQHRM